MRSISLPLLALVSACSPAQPAPVAPTPKPTPSASAAPVAPPASNARWKLPSALQGQTLAELDLGARGVLQVGSGGRRWLIAPDGSVTASPYLLPASLLYVRPSGKQLLLYGTDGTTFLVDDPLGPAVVTRVTPVPPTRRLQTLHAAGKTALLALDASGELLRSTDEAASFQRSKLPLLPGDDVRGIVANAKGQVLVLLYPQRVLYSGDDGASFAPLATPGIGAAEILRDAKDDLFLVGAIVEKRARLIGAPARFELTDQLPAEFRVRKAEPTGKAAGKPRRQVVGDRIVEEQVVADPVTKRRKISVSVQSFGGEPSAPFTIAASVSPFARVRFAGHGKDLVADVYEAEADPPTSKLFRSTDEGKSWQQIDTLEGKEGPGFRVLLAPDWIAVGELCDHDKECRPARARSLDKKDWQPLGLPPHARLSSVEYDAKTDRLVLLIEEGKTNQVWAGKRGGKPARVEAKELEAFPVATTMNGAGALVLAYAYPSRVVTLGADGKLGKPVYLPFEAESLDLAADHGYANASGQAWETGDSGAHWAKVASGGSGLPACAPSGCLQGDAVRVGWDLPDPNKTLVAATEQPPEKKKGAPPPPEPVGPPIMIACKAVGKPTKLEGSLWGESRAAFDGDVRFVTLIGGEDSTTALGVAKGSSPPVKVKLLAPAPKSTKLVTREWVDTKAQGVVIARYTYDPEAKHTEDGTKEYNPVDVELGWYAAKTGKAHKASLPKQKPFRVGRVAPSALHVITDGGLLFMPGTGEAPMYFLQDDGKQVVIPRPAGADTYGFTDGFKSGDRIVLTQVRGDATAIVSSEDLGKTWSTVVWSLGEPVTLLSLEGAPYLGFGFTTPFGPALPTGVLSIPKLSNDPPPVRRLAEGALAIGDKGFEACSAKARSGLRAYTWGDNTGRYVTFKLQTSEGPSTELPTSGHYLRVGTDGSVCTDMVLASSPTDLGSFQLLERPDDPAHAWLVKTKDDGTSTLQAAVCTP